MYSKIGIIVQARMSSSRLSGKSLKLIGKKPFIWYVVQRLKLLNLPVIVCTSDHLSDEVLCDYLKTQHIPFYRGSLENVLQRYIGAAEEFGIENIVRVTGDNPLVDIEFLKKSLHLFENFNYVDGIYDNGFVMGTGFELVTLHELKNIPSSRKDYLEHVTLWLRDNLTASKKRMQLKPMEYNATDDAIFLTCDYEEDLKLLQIIFEEFNYRVNIPVREIIAFLKENPILFEINKQKHLQSRF